MELRREREERALEHCYARVSDSGIRISVEEKNGGKNSKKGGEDAAGGEREKGLQSPQLNKPGAKQRKKRDTLLIYMYKNGKANFFHRQMGDPPFEFGLREKWGPQALQAEVGDDP